MNYLKEYEIQKANPEEWAKYHAIYRLSNFNEWMSLSFQSDIDRYKRADFYYWIVKNDKKIGGALIKPNLLKCMFTIPPFHKIENMIKVLTLYAQSISDKTKDMIIPDADLRLIKHYQSEGFKIERINKIMVCPTNEYNITWEERYMVIPPKVEHKEAMARLYFETYSKNKLEYIKNQSYDFQVSSVITYFDHIEKTGVSNEWSTLVYDKASSRFIAACVVGLVNDLPYILDFVVHPEFQRRGIASKMMKRTLNLFFKDYPAIRLNSIVGNDAEIFYDKLGFISLAENGYLIKTQKS